jgi:hypothetical protein
MGPCWRILCFKGSVFKGSVANIIVDPEGNFVNEDEEVPDSKDLTDSECVLPTFDKLGRLCRDTASRHYFVAYSLKDPPPAELVKLLGNLPVIDESTLHRPVCVEESFRITEVFPELANDGEDLTMEIYPREIEFDTGYSSPDQSGSYSNFVRHVETRRSRLPVACPVARRS